MEPTLNYERQSALGALINIIAFNMRQTFDAALQAHGLDVSVWPVLVCLWEQDGTPQARIGELLGVPGYAMSRGIDRLEKKGLVERRFDPSNRRLRRVFLTAAGRAIRETLDPLAVELNQRYLAPLCAEEQETLLRLLQTINQALPPESPLPDVADPLFLTRC